MRAKNFQLQEEIKSLKEERSRWTKLRRSIKNKIAAGAELNAVEVLEEKLGDAETLIRDYRDENATLKCEIREIKVDLNFA